ncbi:MAG TPA: 8-amino-7-oxononanoate synthase [Rhodocyclaceae bacterium]|nr:8-amino-7-oxononanoate synthase [Rhodocyclaceae bacterium]HMZ84545.1 8-amino-7-oxononanoate synthase [Rhodocyclaceae bacterium]HNA03172.1 8-amino-7-oxononanoate synthase [Rhodocyclaceae bacterium]HNH13329.1 8-amino-7-oxononanoate synthase [Rhodocyclaceae bacterium]
MPCSAERPAALAALETELASLAGQGLQRRRRIVEGVCGPLVEVDGRTQLAFASNDYLGLAGHRDIVAAAREGAERYGIGSGASHLVSGHSRAHELLEARLAGFVGMPRALGFCTGYMANLAVIPALLGRNDAVFADRLNHASLVDAAVLSRAEHHRFPHRDLAALERQLARSEAPRKLIATDAVFSMDGDIAPLPGLLDLAQKHDAWLLVDDAHGFGVLGPQGRGTLAHFGLASPRLILMGTLGKAAGVAGAFVAAHETVIEWLLQRSRPYIFTTAAPPLLAHALLTAIDLIERGDARRAHLNALIARLRDGLNGLRWPLADSRTPIQPLIIGDNHATLAVAQALDAQGIWTPAIRPPTVPRGEARLRISLTAAHDEVQVERLVSALRALA